ncbi:hypothetical protein NE237_014478 [Protea cynaroides]|uniref:Uncharacterized protein n=1 Tax=Protea cynaroides TaxID=273540 RepID=A0A9Q0KC63_9MAGN|nr:hypothetical protein NE237_014478 [Protea cynaroides]
MFPLSLPKMVQGHPMIESPWSRPWKGKRDGGSQWEDAKVMWHGQDDGDTKSGVRKGGQGGMARTKFDLKMGLVPIYRHYTTASKFRMYSSAHRGLSSASGCALLMKIPDTDQCGVWAKSSCLPIGRRGRGLYMLEVKQLQGARKCATFKRMLVPEVTWEGVCLLGYFPCF